MIATGAARAAVSNSELMKPDLLRIFTSSEFRMTACVIAVPITLRLSASDLCLITHTGLEGARIDTPPAEIPQAEIPQTLPNLFCLQALTITPLAKRPSGCTMPPVGVFWQPKLNFKPKDVFDRLIRLTPR